jgi:hypothetical protein
MNLFILLTLKITGEQEEYSWWIQTVLFMAIGQQLFLQSGSKITRN